MKHLHRRVIITGLVSVVLIAGAYALLGIGFAAIVAVGLFVILALVLIGVVLFEDESRAPSWTAAEEPNKDHGYHPAR